MKSLSDDVADYFDELNSYSEKIKEELRTAPEGRLRILNGGDKPRYYRRKEGVGTAGEEGCYLKKGEAMIAMKLAQKDYNKKLLAEILSQTRALKNAPGNVGRERLESIYSGMTEARRKLVTPLITPKEIIVNEWLAIPYEPKGFAEDTPEIYTEAGERVRSKSEKLIADKLRLMGIPYKYECPMKLAGYGTVYPDFTLLNKNTMKQAVLEHFGK
ncbi:MAG: hypothetical protein J5626_00175, partial [Lachnospiraceae bacterium]|nr:hypothetical protein [Lachnospiraceae bacterium]